MFIEFTNLLLLEHGSETFNEFLDFLGERINLLGFTGYNGGLDVKSKASNATQFFKVLKLL